MLLARFAVQYISHPFSPGSRTGARIARPPAEFHYNFPYLRAFQREAFVRHFFGTRASSL